MDLYRETDYPVINGEGVNAALCTVWNNPFDLVKKFPILREKFALIGSLYSIVGISPILRNLALHPEIRQLIVWNNGRLSNTKMGRNAASILEVLWYNGIDEEGSVFGAPYFVEREIDRKVLNAIRNDVSLISARGVSDPALLPTLVAMNQGTNGRAPTSFPDPKPTRTTRFPAETVGHLVRSPTVYGAWQQALRDIMRYGVNKGTQWGMWAKELVGLVWVITEEDPANFAVPADWPATLVDLTGTSPSRIEEYVRDMLVAVKPEEGTYTYGSRLHGYPIGDDEKLDQVVDILIRNFKDSPDSRRAVATTMLPPKDWNSANPPCLTTIQCLQADGKLSMIVNFRSHDMFKAALANAVAMRHLQKQVAAETNFALGELMIVSASAHVYQSDWGEALKVVECAYDGNLPEDELKPDPRGNFVISLSGETIKLSLLAPNGLELKTVEEPTAQTLMARVARLRLAIDPYHLMYIGRELARAEEAIRTGQPYVQS